MTPEPCCSVVDGRSVNHGLFYGLTFEMTLPLRVRVEREVRRR